jgi:hypothetical protein
MDLASKLRIIQARMNVSRDTLAALFDTAPTTLDGWFSGKFCPPGIVVRFIDALLAHPTLDGWLDGQYERDHDREVPRKSRRPAINILRVGQERQAPAGEIPIL